MIRFVEEAQDELLDAISYYEAAHAGLGARFKDSVNESVAWIVKNPEALAVRPDGSRRINLSVFPYYLPYIVRSATIWVLAVAHSSRRPHYWITRRLK